MGTKGTKEWADHNVNLIDGCAHDCRYCYAKRMAIRFKRKTEATWKIMAIRQHDVDKNYVKRKGRIMFPTSHDILPEEPYFSACMTVLRKLLEAGNDVLVTTKPHYSVVKYICDTFAPNRSQIQFRFTITSIHDEVLREWEPGAPGFQERFLALRHAYQAGFHTSISCEPALDPICDIVVLHDIVREFVTESFWIGKMNHAKSPVTLNVEGLREAFKGVPKVRFKDSISCKFRGNDRAG
ncbi:MAG: hypothetical protein Q6365_016430 [Candidatus Sigynarchaeota archaeon]